MGSDFEYAAVALDHARQPRNLGPLDSCNGHARITGSCGDTMELWLQIRDDRVCRVGFITDGCGSSLACGSITTELATGRTVEEAYVIEQKDVLDALGGLPEESRHCAVLAAETLRAACEDFIKKGRPLPENEPTPPESCDICDTTSCSAKQRQQEESDKEFAERQQLERRMCRIRHKILVLSGKGGVGKSTVAANLAVSLAEAGKKVGLLDIDIHGPSIPRLLGLERQQIGTTEQGMLPVRMTQNLSVMSIGFMLGNRSTPVIWRGPRKYGAIRQFLKDVLWGSLDYLVVDSPPGTGDEPLSIAQLVGTGAQALIVTTPQDLAIADVRRCVSFCRSLSLPVLGIVENMSGYVCPQCGRKTDLFKAGGGKALADETGVPFLGVIPIEPDIVTSGDGGRPFAQEHTHTAAAAAFADLVSAILGGHNETTPLSKHERRTSV